MNVPPLSEDKISTDGKSNFQTTFERLKANNALFLIILLGLLIVVFGGYLIWLNQNTVPSENKRFRDEPVPTITPIPSITPIPPTPTDLPVANISSLKGKLIYKNGNSIIISDVDGSNQALLFKSDNPKFQFAGWSDEGKVFYYTEEVKSKGIVYKKDLSTGKVTQLFTFNTLDSRVPDEFEEGMYEQPLQVTVRKDGKFALYKNNGFDLSLFDITNKTSKKLLKYSPCWDGGENECGPTGKYYSYSFPSWSPDGLRAKVIVGYYEGFGTVVFNPFSDSILSKEIETEIGDKINFRSCPSEWSGDSQMLVFACGGYGGLGLHIVTGFSNLKTEDLLASNSEMNKLAVLSAAISDNNEIAFITYGTEGKGERITLYSLKDNSTKPLVDLPSSVYKVDFWFLDSRNFLYSKRENNESQTVQALWVFDTITLSQKQLPIKVDDVIGLIQ